MDECKNHFKYNIKTILLGTCAVMRPPQALDSPTRGQRILHVYPIVNPIYIIYYNVYIPPYIFMGELHASDLVLLWVQKRNILNTVTLVTDIVVCTRAWWDIETGF